MDFVQNLVTTFNFILQGLGVTIGVTLVALAIGLVFGVTMAMARVYGNPLLQAIAAAYSVIIRAVPVVVIIFILFFVIARFVNLSPFWAGSLALGFASGAYQSEIFRGAFRAVPSGQMIAARAIGMSKLQAIRSIILPQAVRLALPAWGNEATLVLKDSTLVFVVGVPEILRRAQQVSARTLEPFVAFSVAMLLYLALTLLTTQILQWFERRYRLQM
ncbi:MULTISPECIES: amino acid ABC transporter permease [Caldilinea]|jgi:polar amino acid transport system permease protein|uniref:Putative amino acid ABC transporter permease protein n=1 Tax=Caldilinea aerophila (strain DSM 14535 / JCM 11387 / NBRC 104270 / STL-6-O1) TaxID=926550 RepID=I0HZZ6_CALAS|nr:MULTISPECIES: amino acid ABC transporter permease [Caldilinea]MBO9392118.1 amino acid ABC transporter permease [Caldilinea sp.]BAL98583.1 putative amino acid ABC transporter permease protein [Caldilinea aerophila DSM 14535 = NBRC 104270]GIV74835.1 MAG: amino acid ABC transporter permease [Caldilinea sp.]